jgi:hypothetical protein
MWQTWHSLAARLLLLFPAQTGREGADMMFAVGILIIGFAATTIIGATWLALTAPGDPLQ